MATITEQQTRRITRVHDEIIELEQSVVDDSIAAYGAARDLLEDVESLSVSAMVNKRRLYKRAWEASVAALLVKRAVLVYLEGGDDDDPNPSF